MKYSIQTNLIIAIFILCQKPPGLEYQNDKNLKTLGKGVFKIEVNSSVIVFKDSNLTKPISKNLLNNSIVTPLLYKPDYDINYYIYNNSTNRYLSLNSKDNQVLYIKNNKSLFIFDWNTFLKYEVFNLSIKDSILNRPQYFIDGKYIITSSWQNDDVQDILEVHGDWVKIKNETRKIIYWIKWKNSNKLLVYLNMLV